jgi:hypothetical protein
VTQKLAEDEQYAQALSLLPLGRSEPGIRGYDEMRHIINDAMVAILQDGANVTDTLQAASVQVDLLLANSGPDSDVIYPSGGMLVYTDTQGLSTTVEFPSGAIEFTQTVSYVPLDDLPTDGLAFALVPNMEFSQPVTITIYYRDSDVIGMDEDLLQLYIYDWSAGSWVDADPCGGYIRDADNKILQAVVCHFTDYALMDPPSYIYLPLVVRN